MYKAVNIVQISNVENNNQLIIKWVKTISQ